MIETVAILALVLAGLAVVLHFIPAKDLHSAAIQKAQADVDSVWDWIAKQVEPSKAAPASQSVTVHPITVTTGAPAATTQPAVAAPAPTPTVNGVAVPPDTDYATFNALVVATQAVKASLATTGIDFTQQTAAWWASLGRFMREEYLAQATGAVLAHFQTLAGPPLETISVMDQTAANAAVNAVTNKP